MKSKMIFCLSLICILCLGFFSSIKAQQSSVRFNSGITIAIKTEITPADPTNRTSGNFGYSVSTSTSENTMHRVLTDKKNKLYFGYDVTVTPQSEKDKFKVSIKPLSIDPNKLRINLENLAAQVLPKYPDEILIDDGDTITLEILENPQTKVKIFDLVKITTENRSGGNYFSEKKPARDFTIDDVILHVTNFEVFVNGEKIGKGGGSVSGANIYFYLPERGRFIMSPFPRKGFNLQKIGVVENNKVSFNFNGEEYKFASSSPILGSGGKWNLWILHDADYRSSFSANSPYEFGAADKIEFLFKK
jgi:hypothetical protein